MRPERCISPPRPKRFARRQIAVPAVIVTNTGLPSYVGARLTSPPRVPDTVPEIVVLPITRPMVIAAFAA